MPPLPLFPAPATPASAHGALRLAAQSATFSRLELTRALYLARKELTPDALAEVVRLLNAAEHLAASIHALLPQ